MKTAALVRNPFRAWRPAGSIRRLLQLFSGRRIRFLSEDGDAGSSESREQNAEEKGRMQQAGSILEQYGSRILRLAFSYLHSRADAEEVVQDTLIQYMTRAPVFKSAEHEKAWVFRTAANLAKNRIQYNRVRESDALSEELAAEHREDLSFVWEAVKQLPEQYRMEVHLFYEEGMQTREMAEILGKKESTVRSDLHRARARLKELLKEDWDV